MRKRELKNEERRGHQNATHVIELSHGDIAAVTPDEWGVFWVPLLTLGAREIFCVVECEVIDGFRDSSDPAFDSTLMTIIDAGANYTFTGGIEMNRNSSGRKYRLKGDQTLYAEYPEGTIVYANIVISLGKSAADLDRGGANIYIRGQPDSTIVEEEIEK